LSITTSTGLVEGSLTEPVRLTCDRGNVLARDSGCAGATRFMRGIRHCGGHRTSGGSGVVAATIVAGGTGEDYRRFLSDEARAFWAIPADLESLHGAPGEAGAIQRVQVPSG
jgi:hypothetical protein